MLPSLTLSKAQAVGGKGCRECHGWSDAILDPIWIQLMVCSEMDEGKQMLKIQCLSSLILASILIDWPALTTAYPNHTTLFCVFQAELLDLGAAAASSVSVLLQKVR